MAIQRDREQIGVQPSGRLIREFRTDLPEPVIGSVVSRLGSTLGDVGEGLMKQEADKAAKEAIAAAPVKDQNGNYIAPMPPENFGPYAARVFSDAVDTRYKNNVVQDFQTKLNEIASANQNDPVRAYNLMDAHARGVIKGADPRFAKDFEATFIREVNERQRGILNLNASRERESTIRDLQIQATRYNEQAIDAWSRSVGNPEMEAEARRLEGEAYRTQQRLVELKADTPMGLQQLEATQRANRFSGTVLSAINRSIEEGSITPEALADLHMISQGIGGKKSVTIGGMTVSADQVLTEVSDPRVRQMLGNRINVVRNDLIKGFERDTVAANAKRINDYFDANLNAPGFPTNITDEQQRQAVMAWATSPDVNVNPFTPEGFQRVIIRYGAVPKGLYSDTFSDLNMKSAKQLEALRPLYEAMGKTMLRDGKITSVREQVLSAKDDAFMRAYSLMRGGVEGLTETDAAKRAQDILDAGVKKLDTDGSYGVLMKSYAPGRANAKTADLNRRMNELSGINVDNLTQSAKGEFAANVAIFAATGMSFEDAVKRGSAHFKKNYEANKYTIDYAQKGEGGYTAKATNPMPLRSADGSAGYDYLQPLVQLAISENASPTQYFETPLDKLVVGKNLFLKPIGTSSANPTFQLYFRENGEERAVLTRDGSTVTIYTGRYMRAQEEYSGNALIELQKTPRGIGPVDLSPGADLMGVFPGSGAPEASPIRSEFAPYLKPRPEHVQPPFIIQKMLEGRNTDRIDLQTLPKKNQRRSEMEGNIRTVSTGESRLMADAGSATITRAMDFLGVDESNGKAVLTDFFKKTLGEDIDPTKVPWCAVWANGILRETGYLGTNSKLARSFLAYGETPEKPSNGDIVVLRRGSSETTGHVGFFMGYKEQNGRRFVRVLGGNQNDTVSEQLFPADQVLGIRRPVKLQQARNLPGIDGTMFSELEGDIG